MALVCVSVTAATTAMAHEQIRTAKGRGADVVELRIDFLEHGQEWESLVSTRPMSMIVTNRAAWEGGRSKEAEEARLGRLIRAQELGAEFIDVELKAAATYHALRSASTGDRRAGKSILILSHHDFEKTPSENELSTLHMSMLQAKADICKIAVTARDIADCISVFELLQAVPTPTIALCMGERGVLTRLLATRFGSFLTFTSLGREQESAPGQVEVTDLLSLYRFRKVDAFTDMYGIIGNPVAHSMSPAIHNAAFRRRKRNAVYLPLLVDDVAKFLEAFRPYDFRGFSITIPHKEAAVKCVDVLDEVAAQIGAINTIVRLKDGRLKGYNTDWMAAIGAVESKLLAMEERKESSARRRSTTDGLRFSERDEEDRRPLQGKHVVLIGAGGAARGMAFGAVARGARTLTIVNRTVERAQALIDAMPHGSGCTCRSMTPDAFAQAGEGSAASTMDVLMNSTSIGMHPHEDATPVDQSLLRPGLVVFDAVYNPRRTRLLREAEAKSCQLVDGVEMFVGQALKQYEIWTGTEPPRDVMQEAVLKHLGL